MEGSKSVDQNILVDYSNGPKSYLLLPINIEGKLVNTVIK